MAKTKITTGANDRPKNASIAETGSGLPDDSSRPVNIDEQEASRLETNIRGMGKPGPTGPEMPYDVSSAHNVVETPGGSVAETSALAGSATKVVEATELRKRSGTKD